MQAELFQDVLELSKYKYGEKTALITDEGELSFHQLDAYANGLAWQLQSQGVCEGDRVILALGNSQEMIIAFWAVLKAGGIACPIGLDLASKKIDYILSDSGAKLCITNENRSHFEWKSEDRPKVLILNRNPGDLASILYTSGSTGEPKGVMLSHENMLAALSSLNTYLQYNDQDRVICVSPLSFDYGLYQMFMSISQGAELHLFKNLLFPATLLKAIEKKKLTVLPGVPTVYSLLFEHSKKFKFDLSSIRMVTNTGAAMTLRHIEMAKLLFPQAEIFSMYGLTECKRCTYLPPKDLDRKPGSVGIAIPNTRIWIADTVGMPLPPNQVGQLVVEGETVMQGYWNKPEATQQKLPNGPGQLFTGDYGYLDDEGYFYFVGRMDDMLKCRGQKVSPKELEDIIIQMEGVKEIAVIGVPDTDESDAIHLHIAPFNEGQISEAKVRAYCREHLASHQQPRSVYFHRALPKSENGKINKRALKSPQSLIQLISATIERYPEREALFVDDRAYTYKELEQKALECANVIQQFTGETCALLCSRSEALYIGLLASLYAGKAYVPISTRIPLARNRIMLEESKTTIVILDQKGEQIFKPLLLEYTTSLNIILYGFNEVPTWAKEAVQHNFILANNKTNHTFKPANLSGDSPAYLLFTSGSTGIPKGVMVSHSNMLAYYQNGLDVYQPTSDDRFAQVTELTFDLAMHDIFLAWGTGASLYTLPDSLYGSLSFYLGVAKFIQQNQITFWMSVPSTGTILKQLGLLKENQFPSLKCTVFCGEPLSSNMTFAWQSAAQNSKVFNLYGPTEATIGFTYFQYNQHVPKDTIVPIGRPFSTQHVAILDDHFEPCHIGKTGELYLGGSQVVVGYWKNPDKTKERFIELEIDSIKRTWYRTGDLVYMSMDGELQYMGRVDDQIKIRGSRVEKLEIENILRRAAGIDMVAVVPWPLADDGTVLGVVAFMTESAKPIEIIIQEAKKEMPDYMVPKEIYLLDELPLNQNGKVDYKALKFKLTQSGA